MNTSNEMDALRLEMARAYRLPETQLLPGLMTLASSTESEWSAIETCALQLIAGVRNGHHVNKSDSKPWVADLLREYPLSSKQGLALMGLAECCLRVPDIPTQQLLIRDKLLQADWRQRVSNSTSSKSQNRVVNTATLGLQLAQYLLQARANWLHMVVRKASEPLIRRTSLLAMRLMGDQFVFGNDIAAALKRARRNHSRCSFDMLGEAARTAADAQRYFAAYHQAIAAVAAEVSSGQSVVGQHSISIKLSALHPRYETLQATRTLPELLSQLLTLAELAMQNNVGLTIDAEECDRLDISLDIIDQLLQAPRLRDWQGLGLAVQAYQKRALPTIKWLDALAHHHRRRIGVRLVKGAYWDMEIKRCQERGLSDFPVFTRKTATDVSYLACARQLLASTRLVPAFATHNALTIATLLPWIGERRDVEFQRLHGMAATLYQNVTQQHGIPCRVYAPVGKHQELLPYLIRRMLENSSNSGFVQQLGNPQVPEQTLVANPIDTVRRNGCTPHPAIQTPAAIFGRRRNSIGLDLSDRQTLQALANSIERFDQVQPSITRPLFVSDVIDNSTA